MGGHPCRSFAPGARTIRMCSLNGRSRTDRGALPKGTTRKLGESIYISLDANTREEEIKPLNPFVAQVSPQIDSFTRPP